MFCKKKSSLYCPIYKCWKQFEWKVVYGFDGFSGMSWLEWIDQVEVRMLLLQYLKIWSMNYVVIVLSSYFCNCIIVNNWTKTIKFWTEWLFELTWHLKFSLWKFSQQLITGNPSNFRFFLLLQNFTTIFLFGYRLASPPSHQ